MKIKNLPGLIYRVFVGALLLLVFIQPDIQYPFIALISENTIWLILGLTGAGILFMFFRNTGLIYFSMISAAVLTMYVKDTSSNDLIYAEKDNSDNVFSLRQYNILSFNGNYDKLISSVRENASDIIAIADVSPDAAKQLHAELTEEYPVFAELIDENENSKLIFSKFKASVIDTLNFYGIQQFKIEYDIYGVPVNIIFPNIFSPRQKSVDITEESQIRILAETVNRLQYKPLLVIGDFSQVYWSREMRNFKYQTKLNNARRFVNAISNRNPHNHVFYSDHINCISFGDVYDNSSNVIGVQGSFEILKPEITYYTVNYFGDMRKKNKLREGVMSLSSK